MCIKRNTYIKRKCCWFYLDFHKVSIVEMISKGTSALLVQISSHGGSQLSCHIGLLKQYPQRDQHEYIHLSSIGRFEESKARGFF